MMMRPAEEVGFDFVGPLLAYRFRIALAILFFAIITLIIRLLTPTEYLATVTLEPAKDFEKDPAFSESGLTGVVQNVGATYTATEFERFVYLVYSPELAEWQIKHRDIRPLIFPDLWDPIGRVWHPRTLFPTLFDGVTTTAAYSGGPSAGDIAKEYAEHLSETKDIALYRGGGTPTGLVTLSYLDTNKDRARIVLSRIISDTNEILRAQAQRHAFDFAQSLQTTLDHESIMEYRTTLQKLLSEQKQIILVTESHAPYAAVPLAGESLAAAQVPKKILFFTLAGGGLGLSLAYFVAILRYNTRPIVDLNTGQTRALLRRW